MPGGQNNQQSDQRRSVDPRDEQGPDGAQHQEDAAEHAGASPLGLLRPLRGRGLQDVHKRMMLHWFTMLLHTYLKPKVPRVYGNSDIPPVLVELHAMLGSIFEPSIESEQVMLKFHTMLINSNFFEPSVELEHDA